MQLLPEFPDRYWLKFSEEPVEIVPYDAQAKTFAAEYEQKLQDLLKEYPVQIYHRGSTALEIAGKGDIEIGVIPDPEYWFEIIVFLAQQFQGLGNLDEEYARFNDVKDGFDIEIILMRGYTALLDRRFA
ncbi:GrpB family protein [Candidatus Woesebacteria bacterium]|nr:GrpB family protein [Candidatus Woesebacteria bacterium]